MPNVPNPNPVPNVAEVSYEYQITPGQAPESGRDESNTVYTQVNTASIIANKSSDKEYTDISDVISYTFDVQNTGNTVANSVILYDSLPGGVTFINGSVKIDGVTAPLEDPRVGIHLGSIGGGAAKTVLFEVIVSSVPESGLLVNRGRVSYTYTVDPKFPDAVTGEIPTNIVTTHVSHADISFDNGGFIKQVNMVTAKVGDVLTYTLNVKNTGNTDANNVIITDAIPDGAVFVESSITVNGAARPGAEIEPPSALILGTLSPGQSVAIKFNAVITELPDDPLQNYGRVTYNYTVDPSKPNGASGDKESNRVITTVNEAIIDFLNGGGFTKTVDLPLAKLDDMLTYTVNMENKGNTAAVDIVYTDPIPNCTVFIKDSVTLNGVPVPGVSVEPGHGVEVGTLKPGEKAVLTFSVRITDIPPDPLVQNIGYVKFLYTMDPSHPDEEHGKGSSNVAETTVKTAYIDYINGESFVKTVDKQFAEVSETVKYTLIIENIGNVDAEDVVFTDIVPEGMVYRQNSMKYNGALIPGNPSDSVNLGVLPPYVKNTLEFEVTVVDVPSVNPIPNTSDIHYLYTLDPKIPDKEEGDGTSNTVYTLAVKGGLATGDFVKSADKEFVRRGDEITYSFIIDNNGTVDIKDVVLTENDIECASFVKGSVTIDGVSYPDYNPFTGIPVGIIGAGTKIAVTMKYIVTCIPVSVSSVIVNSARLNYHYSVDPSQPDIAKSIWSNEAEVYVREVSIDFFDGGYIKSVDVSTAGEGDTLNYTLYLKNTGNVDAENCRLYDKLTAEAEFIAGSVSLDGVAYPEYDVVKGISLGTLKPGTVRTLRFSALVKGIPDDNSIKNKGFIDYEYVVSPGYEPIKGSGASNEVETVILRADFSGSNFVKSSSPVYAAIGDIITYSFSIKNAGNADAQDVLLKDAIPQELEYVENSAVYNGVPVPSPDFTAGVELGTIAWKSTNTNIFTFQAKVISIPPTNPIQNIGTLDYYYSVNPLTPRKHGYANSNTVNNYIFSAVIGLTKTCDKACAIVGDRITYTLEVVNSGNTAAKNIEITDVLQGELEFVARSVVIDGVVHEDYDITEGIIIDAINPDKMVVVEFQSIITGIPSGGKTINIATASWQFTVKPESGTEADPKTDFSESNPVETIIGAAELTLVKTAGIYNVMLNDIVNFTVTVENTGTLTAEGVVLFDKLPSQLEFVKGSVVLNGSPAGSADIIKGVRLGTLLPKTGYKTVVSYKVKVIDSRECCGVIENGAYTVFNFGFLECAGVREKTSGIASAKIIARSPAFRQMSIDGILEIPCEKPDAEDINGVTANVEITGYKVIKTPSGRANDGTILTGYKLLVLGKLHQTVEYMADDALQSIHSAHYSKLFSTYIILSKNVSVNSKAQFNVVVEDIYYKRLNGRQLFINATVMISASTAAFC